MVKLSKAKITPKDLFLQLLSVIMLYFTGFHLGLLLYQIINLTFPDPLMDYIASSEQYYSPLRWSLATLVIVFPVYLWTQKYLAKYYHQQPQKRRLGLIRWLTYFTLFATALIIIGDLVALLNRYLEGDLTARFLLKVLTVFVIAAGIFFYYYTQLHYQRFNHRPSVIWFKRLVIPLVVLTVIVGFVTAGSPQTQRLRRFDDKRIQDLQYLQSLIVQYWQDKDALPQQLSQLEDPLANVIIPTDPQTNQPYDYQPLEELSFQLCAQFATGGKTQASPALKPTLTTEDNWQHPQGKHCFQRQIDPQRYQNDLRRPIAPIPIR